MAKNYAAIYASGNDSQAIEQKMYLKLEGARGQFAVPGNNDFLYTLAGGGLEYVQPLESSLHRSGRHHTDMLKKKSESTFSFSTYFNIDTTLGVASSAEIDTPVRLLFKSALGYEDISAGAFYDTRLAPDITFSLYEVGDLWANQASGAFVQGANLQFPGDGEATVEWTGDAKTVYRTGIAKSVVDNNGGNTVTITSGEEYRFEVGCQVMLIEADGTTRSADTLSGTARTVTDKIGNVITLSGLPLADADGSVTPIYLCYYEPSAPTGINNPVTGLVGSVSIASLGGSICARSVGFNIQNDHEKQDYCYGTDGLGGVFFSATSRVTVTATAEINLNHETLELLNRIKDDEAQAITLVLGEATGRRLEISAPKVKFNVPNFTVPESGTIPYTLEGTCLQTSLEAADEIAVNFT